MNWDKYQQTVQIARRGGDGPLVDMVADRALSAIVGGHRVDNPAVFVRSRRADLARLAEVKHTVPMDTDHAASGGTPEDIVVRADTEATFWADLESRVRARFRADARGRLMAVAHLLADGYAESEVAARLNLPRVRITESKAKLAMVL